MRNILLFFFLLLFIAAEAQDLVEAEFLGSSSKSELTAITGFPAQYGLDYYKVLYTSPDVNNQLDTASGLMAVPQLQGSVPLLCYQHGTTDGKQDVPSNWGVGDAQTGLFGSQGYLSFAPDYLGMGEARGFHPYVHAATEASAAADMARAVRQWLSTQSDLEQNDQLFITGYSQGGHASMAFHRLVEEELGGEFTVTAASHMSGAYSISGEMVKQLLSDEPYFFVAYFAYTTLSYQTAYGNLFDDVEEIFKSPYDDPVRNFFNNYENGASLFSLNTQLLALLNQNVGSAIGYEMVQDSIRTILQDQPEDHPLIQALRENDVYEWAPQAPTRILYCEDDDQVPFTNATLADSVMNELGASQLETFNLNPNFDHAECVSPAFLATFGFFNQFASITVGTEEIAGSPVILYPNPAYDQLLLQLPDGGVADLIISDLQGRILLQENQVPVSGSVELHVGHLPAGLYSLQVLRDGRMEVLRFIKQ